MQFIVRFADGVELNDDNRDLVRGWAIRSRACDLHSFTIFADPRAEAETVSQRRAQIVREILVANGVDGGLIHIRAPTESELAAWPDGAQESETLVVLIQFGR
jgi:outer membrane protein OmpA-like peptidoglycan-associated protein